MMSESVIIPPRLKKGDTIAIVAPAGIVSNDFVEGGAKFLTSAGFNVRVSESVLTDGVGSYSSTADRRLAEFREAWQSDEVKCVLCARGGYGAIHLLDKLDKEFIKAHPKWLIGFSDISALHALLNSVGMQSIHGPMCKHLTTRGEDAATAEMLAILTGEHPGGIVAPGNNYNQPGEATGKLIGGNLAVLNSLAATPYDMLSEPLTEDCILYIEDVSEHIYAIERMLWRLHLAGVLKRLKGLIVGRFTEYRPDRNFPDMETMIHAHLQEWGIDTIPVCFDFPIGHIECNIPVINGARVRLEVDATASRLSYVDR